jgi:threonine aldolase
MTKRLSEDHARARLLEKEMAKIDGIEVFNDSNVNMVFFKVDRSVCSTERLVDEFLANESSIEY